MSSAAELVFVIDAYTPETLPMARLAEYMADLATLLGEQTSVHFVRLDRGSIGLVHKVDREAEPKIKERMRQVRQGNPPLDALRAYRSINKRLKADNGVGVLKEAGAEIVRFPGRETPEEVTFGAFSQHGSVEGKLIRLGGTTDPVPVHLEVAGQRFYSTCFATRELAQRLGAYLFREVRLFGVGRWVRSKDGEWELGRFSISDFELLDELPLSTIVADLRRIPGSDWSKLDDPWGELRRIRHGAGRGGR
jgi:hypothetical protein